MLTFIDKLTIKLTSVKASIHRIAYDQNEGETDGGRGSLKPKCASTALLLHITVWNSRHKIKDDAEADVRLMVRS